MLINRWSLLKLVLWMFVSCLSTKQVDGGLPPVISVRPSNKTEFRGYGVVLTCTVDKKYNAKIDWLKNGLNISDSRIVMGSTSGRLYILQSWESDTGWYRCEATNAYGRDVAEAYVKILGDVPPIIKVAPENTTLHVSQEHYLNCEGKSSPEPKYSWLYNGGAITDPSILQTKGTLHIAHAELHHTGWYTCLVYNTFGSVSAKAYVNVVKDPTIIRSPKNTIGLLRKSVKIVCVASASWPINTMWERNGIRVPRSSRVEYQLHNNNAEVIATLEIKEVRISDEGMYSCVVTNGKGAAYSQSAKLTVVDLPVIHIKSPKITVWKRKDATFICDATGLPAPEIYWIVGGQQFNNSVLPTLTITGFSESNKSQSTLEIFSVSAKDEGVVKCVAKNYVQTTIANFELVVVGEPESPEEVTANLTSSGSTVAVSWKEGHQGGDEPYFIVEFKDKDATKWQRDVTEKGQRIIYLAGKNKWENYEVRVIAVNKYGKSLPSEVVGVTGKHVLPQPKSQDSLVVLIGGTVGGLAFVLLLVSLSLLVYIKLRKPRQAPNINNVSYSVVGDEPRVDLGPQAQLYNLEDETYASLRSLDDEDDDNYTTIPADKNWEVPRASLRIEKILGSGNFGQVVRAVLTDMNDKEKQVAVKMLKDGHSEKDVTDFIKELNLMKSIKHHPNVVSLIGCCTRGGNPYIIVEYLPNGNLRDYLQANRAGRRDLYSNLAPFCKTLTCKDLLSFAWQISKGMSYLASLRLVHRDLAARNVLLSKDLDCKVSDFGLARDIYQDNLYMRTTMGHLPLRWMAYESVFNGISTVESDVWSFGILLWEIVTLGGTPYPDMGRDALLAGLTQGYRMPKLPHCSDETYAVMIECWQQNPEDRPTFAELSKTFQRLKEGQQVWVDLSVYDDNEYYNTVELEEAAKQSSCSLNKKTMNDKKNMEQLEKAETNSADSVKMNDLKVDIQPASGTTKNSDPKTDV